MTTRRAPLREVNALVTNQRAPSLVKAKTAKTAKVPLDELTRALSGQSGAVQRKEPTAPGPRATAPSARAPPAAAAHPILTLERTAIASVFGFSLQSEEEPLVGLCRMHAVILRASRRSDFCEFKQKLRDEIVAGNICLAEGKDLLLVRPCLAPRSRASHPAQSSHTRLD